MTPGPTRTAHRTCPLCEAACGLRITVDGSRAVAVRGNPDDVFSHGYLCPKGASLARFDEDPDRLERPLLRQPDGSFAEVDWPTAFRALEAGLRPVAERHGRDAVALYTGNQAIHTIAIPLYLSVLASSFGTRNVYSTRTLDTMPRHVACGLLYGDPLANPVPDLDRTQHLLVFGSNLLETNGSMWTVPGLPAKLAALAARGGRFVVVDPRRTRTAQRADQHVPIRPGGDPFLLLGMLHTLFAEDLATDPGPHVTGFDQLRALALGFPPDRVAAPAGVPADVIRALARDLAAAPSAAVHGRLGTSTTEFGALTSWLIEALAIVTGNLDRPGGVMFGQAPHTTPPLDGPFRTGRWHSRVRGLPEVAGELPTATLADEIETPGDGQVRALVVIGGNPVLAAPHGDRLDRALAGLDFLVCVDPYLNETSRHAHLILPPPRLLESAHYDVVLTRRAGRRFARYTPAVFPPPPDRPSEGEILARIALVGSGRPVTADPDRVDGAVVDRMLRAAAARPGSPLAGRTDLAGQLTGDTAVERRLDAMVRLGPFGDLFGARPGGLSLALLRDHPEGVDLGPLEPQLPGVLATASGAVELCPPPLVADLDRLRDRMSRPVPEFTLITRRRLRSVNSWSHNIAALAGGSNTCVAELNPADAARLGVADGAPVRLAGRHGAVLAVAAVTDAVAPGVVSVPYGWGHGRPGTRLGRANADPGVSVNALTDDAVVDPLSGVAVFNAVPISVSAIPVSAAPLEEPS